MVIVSPLRIGLWDPFQMAFSWLINGGDPNYSLVLGWSSKYLGNPHVSTPWKLNKKPQSLKTWRKMFRLLSKKNVVENRPPQNKKNVFFKEKTNTLAEFLWGKAKQPPPHPIIRPWNPNFKHHLRRPLCVWNMKCVRTRYTLGSTHIAGWKMDLDWRWCFYWRWWYSSRLCDRLPEASFFGIGFFCSKMQDHIHSPETNSEFASENRPSDKTKFLASNHWFSGANWLLVSGRAYILTFTAMFIP